MNHINRGKLTQFLYRTYYGCHSGKSRVFVLVVRILFISNHIDMKHQHTIWRTHRALMSMVLALSLLTNLSSAQSDNTIPDYSYGREGESTQHRLTDERIHSIAEWEQLRWHLKQNMLAVMGPLPIRSVTPKMAKAKVIDTIYEENFTRYSLKIPALDEIWVPAYFYVPKRIGVDGKSPGMLALHPTGKQGKGIVDGQGKPNRAYARELAERGYVVIAPDYPSFGDFSEYDFNNDPYESATMAAIDFHMRCVDYLEQHARVDPDRIGVIGHSLGGHNALFLSALDERIRVVVTSCGWTQFDYYDTGPSGIERYGGRLGPWAQERYMPWIREKYNLDGDLLPFNFHEVLALIAPRGCFTNAPRHDANFSMEGVINGLAKARPIYQLLDAEDHLQVRHPDAAHDFPTQVRRESYEFIDQHLDHTPSVHTIE